MATRAKQHIINEIEMDTLPYPVAYPQQKNLVNANPLPPNWEAKYDPTSKRFYYINHTDKTTTWVDPRQSAPAPTPYNVILPAGSVEGITAVPQLWQPQASTSQAWPATSTPIIQHSSGISSPSHSKSSPHSSPHGSNSKKLILTSPQRSPHASCRSPPQLSSRSDDKSEHIPMSTISTIEKKEPADWKEEMMIKYGLTFGGDHEEEETTTFVSTDDQLVNKLKSDFIDVTEERILQLMEQYGTNESVLMDHLKKESLKYKDNSRMEAHRASGKKSHQSSRRQSQRSHPSTKNGSVNHSPSFQHLQETQGVTLEVLREQFPDIDFSVLSDVLISCSGDVCKAAYKLNSMGFVKSGQSKPSSRRGSCIPTSITTSSSNATPEHASHGAEQVKRKIFEEFQNLDKAVIQLVLESAEYNESKVRQILQVMNESASAVAERSLSTPRSSITVPLSQPTSPSPYQLPTIDYHLPDTEPEIEITCENRPFENNVAPSSQRNGPNLALHKGPNKALLSERNYISIGPNADIRKGPNPNNVHGPSNRCAKQVLNCGPQPCLLARNSIQVTITNDGISSEGKDSQWLFKLGAKACCWQR